MTDKEKVEKLLTIIRTARDVLQTPGTSKTDIWNALYVPREVEDDWENTYVIGGVPFRFVHGMMYRFVFYGGDVTVARYEGFAHGEIFTDLGEIALNGVKKVEAA